MIQDLVKLTTRIIYHTHQSTLGLSGNQRFPLGLRPCDLGKVEKDPDDKPFKIFLPSTVFLWAAECIFCGFKAVFVAGLSLCCGKLALTKASNHLCLLFLPSQAYVGNVQSTSAAPAQVRHVHGSNLPLNLLFTLNTRKLPFKERVVPWEHMCSLDLY